MSYADSFQDSAADLLPLAQAAARKSDWGRTCHYLYRVQQQATPLTSPAAFQWRDLALRTLQMGDFNVRWDVAKLMAQQSSELIQLEDIVAVLADATEEDWSLAWFLVRLLAEFRCAESVSALVALLQRSPSEDVVAAIITALSQIGEPAIEPVSRLLEEPHARPVAVQILARIRHPAAAAAVVDTVNDADPAVRALAIATLGDLSYPQAKPILIAALSDVAAGVRRAAVIGLGAQRDTLSATAIGKMGALLWDINLSVRRAAISAMGRLRRNQAADILYEALQSNSTPPALRAELIRAIALTETAVGLSHLNAYACARQASGDPSRTWIGDIASSLGRIETPDLAPAAVSLLTLLLAWTQPSNSIARQTIATSLGRLGQINSADTLISMLDTADAGVRLHVTAALRKLAPVEAHRRLMAIASSPQTEPNLRQNVTLALRDWNQSATSANHSH